VMLENPVDGMKVIEDTQHDECIFLAELVDALTHDVTQAAIGPTLDIDELRIRLTLHETSPFGVEMRCTSTARWA
jgi:hypothetical protein